MIIEETFLKGCFIIKPKVFDDDRGYFFESFNMREFEQKTKMAINFVQDNQSKSSRGVLRGLHFQIGQYQQSKLVRVVKGSVLDVCVDLRKNSESYGKHFSVVLNDKDHNQLFIPRGFAHGFLVLEDNTIFAYKCDNYYHKPSERGIIFNDKDINIDWQFSKQELILSDKDKELPTFEAYLKEQ
jgi:dTDP-4-dehydrorhamnose 3,5-epimerase